MTRNALFALVLLLGTEARADAAAPLSAIDWLSDSVALPTAPPAPDTPGGEPMVTDDARPDDVTVAPIGPPVAAAIGRPPAMVGLDDTLWRGSRIDGVAAALASVGPAHYPATQSLLRDLLMAAAPAPMGDEGAQMTLARIDALLALGMLDPAVELIDDTDRETPLPFRRWFDISLLTGHENRACSRMRALPQISPTYTARIFCLVRTGDWPAAIVTLDAARVLDLLSPEDVTRLSRFVDDMGEGEPLDPPERPTPLDYMIFEAVGEPLGTGGLPLAFAHADLRSNTGWRARIDAAERLARAGAIDHAKLWAVYEEREPAASGGVWDRLEAIDAFEAALSGETPGAVSDALPKVWNEMQGAGLGAVFAARYGAELAQRDLDGEAREIAFRAALLAGVAPDELSPEGGEADFLASVARGRPDAAEAAAPEARLVSRAFAGDPPDRARALIDADRTGEALLLAADLLDQGAAGSLDALADGISILVAAGSRERAARAALDYLLLEPAT